MAITYDSYEAAAATLTEEDGKSFMVCGVRVSDTVDAYLVLDRTVPDRVAEEIFYEIKHGRAPSTYEKWVWDMARGRLQEADA